VDEQLRQFPWANYRYQDPHPGFDRSKVIGLVCHQLRVRRPKYILALETVAGDGLYNVLVDTPETAKALNEKSGEKRTYLPLSNIQASSLSDSTIQV